MPDISKPGNGRNYLKAARFSRRQFFERIGVTLGGAALGSLVIASACKPETQETLPATTETLPTTTPAAPSSSETTQILPTETKATTATQGTSLSYAPDTAPPPLVPVPNSSCTVATDRVYSLEHIWVKQYAPGLVAMGITPSMIAILYEPYRVELLEVGKVLAREDSFGTVTGYKTVADLTMPVSGEIIQRNESLTHGVLGAYLTMLNVEPYHHGWLIAVKLSKPDELKDLMSPDDYLYRLKGELAPH